MPWFDDRMTLNTNPAMCFFDDVLEANDTVLHEITHLHGTDDGESGNLWISAPQVAWLLRQDLSAWQPFRFAKWEADRCACRAGSAE
jgi:hypothetical protein